MTKVKIERKTRRKRKKVAPLEDDAGIVAKATYQLRALTRKTAKKKKRAKKSTHPNPVQLGMSIAPLAYMQCVVVHVLAYMWT